MIDALYRELKIHKPAFQQKSNEYENVSMIYLTTTYMVILIIHYERQSANNTNTPVLHMSPHITNTNTPFLHISVTG